VGSVADATLPLPTLNYLSQVLLQRSTIPAKSRAPCFQNAWLALPWPKIISELLLAVLRNKGEHMRRLIEKHPFQEDIASRIMMRLPVIHQPKLDAFPAAHST
jgi:hypothetical protein